MYSDTATQWDNPVVLQEPRFPWEFTQIGNCGSPLWTEEGLVITHGVGAMRQCLGASLFDLDDPSKGGRLKDPCFRHEMNEKVMYPMSYVFCSIIHNNSLILPMPYRTTSTYGVVDMVELDIIEENDGYTTKAYRNPSIPYNRYTTILWG
jgi:hypothetical protein